MRYITMLLAMCVALLSLTGCFKEEKQGTRMLISLYSQNVTNDPIMKTSSDIEGYAFEVKKGSKWEVSSWEDALNHRITNTETGEQQSEDMVYTYANYDTEAEYQLSFELWSTHTFLVVVDRTNKIYATRQYDTPMNLPTVYTQLHLYAHKKSGSANGWTFVNPFPDEAREPLVPTETEENEKEEETKSPQA
ncbi:MAG: hypothetical protein J6R02_00545 [Alistipes sp.]|nr:hypothetical protein [Alistipes sp.]MBO5855361.1 hypothetical protein [Alistipes sp.]